MPRRQAQAAVLLKLYQSSRPTRLQKHNQHSHLTRRHKGRFSRHRRLLQLGNMTATHRFRYQLISLIERPWQLIGYIALHVYPEK